MADLKMRKQPKSPRKHKPQQPHAPVVAAAEAASKKVVEACREAVAELESWSLWAYRDLTGEEWDAQPACFITDYLLAVQCFAFACYVALFGDETNGNMAWYMIYFVALGTSAAFGGLLHHIAYQALREVAWKKKTETAQVFGVDFQRKTVDRFIDISWRLVLGFSILNNFALLSLALSRYLSEAWAYSVIIVAASIYVGLAIWASISMHVLFLFVGYMPAMIFGAIASVTAFDWQWSHPSNELLVYVLKLASGLVQGLIVSPSNDKFNHNALSHVMLSVAATFMLIHYKQ